MNPYNIILISIFFVNCSPKISKHFKKNIKENGMIHNSSLNIKFISYGDINYTKSKRKIRKSARKIDFDFNNEIFLHGIAEDPVYQYFVTIGESLGTPENNNIVVLDTTIKNKKIEFIGSALGERPLKSLKIDLENILNSLEIKN